MFGRWAMAKLAGSGGAAIRLLSSASRGMIVEAGRDEMVTEDRERVLAFMRESLSHTRSGS